MLALTALVSAVFLVCVVGLGHVPRGSSQREVVGLTLLASALAAISYVPARSRIVAAADRLVLGARRRPDEVVRGFADRMTTAVAVDELLLQLAESLRETMSLTSAELYTGSGDVLERLVSVPHRAASSIVLTAREREVIARAGVSGNAWAAVWVPKLLEDRSGDVSLRLAPASHAGELLGMIVLERPASADPFSAEEDMALADLARQVGLAFHNARLDAALQTTLADLREQAQALRDSRARIVATADAERRRIERDLHDGAQQHLLALAVSVRLARAALRDDPAACATLLDQLSEDVQRTAAELREIAHGVYPPLLAADGLRAALGTAAGRYPLRARLAAPGIGRYSPEIEAAVYFCCLEALQNAAKHAPHASVEIRIWEAEGGLLFSVNDDGPGFDPELTGVGHGLVNMADRLGAIGGAIRWESHPGQGARIHGSVPLPDPPGGAVSSRPTG
jgi:signal transduction histidine kinase